MTDEQGENQSSRVDRHSQNAALAEKVPGVAVDRVGGEDSGEALVEQILIAARRMISVTSVVRNGRALR